jgi:Fe-Mn family superoxide dismutase
MMRNAVVPGTPILALDVWNMLLFNYQYRRKIISMRFNVINWKK